VYEYEEREIDRVEEREIKREIYDLILSYKLINIYNIFLIIYLKFVYILTV